MLFLPPRRLWYYSVVHLTAIFDDTKVGSGTGFLVENNNSYNLVTARHVVDPTYLPPPEKRPATCIRVELVFRCQRDLEDGGAQFGYQLCSIDGPEFRLESGDLDVASLPIAAEPLFTRDNEGLTRPCSIPLSALADCDDLSKKFAGEPVAFVGFPENSPVVELEERVLKDPLLRQGIFAYPPTTGIRIEGELGRNYGLIDSFAQSGFSGAPLFSQQFGWPDSPIHSPELHKPPKVVGLVCGHYRSRDDRANGVHAGLSFFARSNSIRDLIAQ